MEVTLFSNVNSAIRRSVWDGLRFADDIIMSEDQEWSARVLLAGWTVLYEPRAAVRHSHVYTVRSAFTRFFDSGVSAERTYLAGARPSARVLRTRSASLRRRRGRVALAVGSAPLDPVRSPVRDVEVPRLAARSSPPAAPDLAQAALQRLPPVLAKWSR